MVIYTDGGEFFLTGVGFSTEVLLGFLPDFLEKLGAGAKQCSRPTRRRRQIWVGGGMVGFAVAEFSHVKGIWKRTVL
jgi:hypothetical protein